jgi:hypothetical protein
MALSPQQLLHMRMALQVFNRMSRTTAEEGASVLESMARLSISRVLENLKDNSDLDGTSSSPAAAAAAAPGAMPPAAAVPDAAGDGVAQIAAVNSELQRHMRLRTIHAVAANNVMLDQLSKEQIADMLVGELLHFGVGLCQLIMHQVPSEAASDLLLYLWPRHLMYAGDFSRAACMRLLKSA